MPELEIYFEKVQDYLATQFMVNEKTGRKKAKYLRTRRLVKEDENTVYSTAF